MQRRQNYTSAQNNVFEKKKLKNIKFTKNNKKSPLGDFLFYDLTIDKINILLYT